MQRKFAESGGRVGQQQKRHVYILVLLKIAALRQCLANVIKLT